MSTNEGTPVRTANLGPQRELGTVGVRPVEMMRALQFASPEEVGFYTATLGQTSFRVINGRGHELTQLGLPERATYGEVSPELENKLSAVREYLQAEGFDEAGTIVKVEEKKGQFARNVSRYHGRFRWFVGRHGHGHGDKASESFVVIAPKPSEEKMTDMAATAKTLAEKINAGKVEEGSLYKRLGAHLVEAQSWKLNHGKTEVPMVVIDSLVQSQGDLQVIDGHPVAHQTETDRIAIMLASSLDDARGIFSTVNDRFGSQKKDVVLSEGAKKAAYASFVDNLDAALSTRPQTRAERRYGPVRPGREVSLGTVDSVSRIGIRDAVGTPMYPKMRGFQVGERTYYILRDGTAYYRAKDENGKMQTYSVKAPVSVREVEGEDGTTHTELFKKVEPDMHLGETYLTYDQALRHSPKREGSQVVPAETNDPFGGRRRIGYRVETPKK